MSLVLNGSGTITGLSAGGLPDSSVTTAEIADAAVTQAKLGTNVAGNGPAFYAYGSTGTSMSANTQTKVNFQTEDFDTNSNFDTSTSRFQPTVAGFYWIGTTIRFDVTNNIVVHAYINHSRLGTVGTGTFVSTPSSGSASHASTLAYCNGTTDYVEAACYVNLAGTTSTGRGITYFTGFLARAA